MIKRWLSSVVVRTRRSFTWEYRDGKPSGYCDAVELTGRRKPFPICGIRHGMINRQYRCLDCGHVGWSRHIDLERLEGSGPKARTRRRRGDGEQ
jgi:hypothetical protein